MEVVAARKLLALSLDPSFLAHGRPDPPLLSGSASLSLTANEMLLEFGNVSMWNYWVLIRRLLVSHVAGLLASSVCRYSRGTSPARSPSSSIKV